jgi:hypothetical protein
MSTGGGPELVSDDEVFGVTAAGAVVVTVGDPLLLGENTLDDGGGGDIELAMAGTVGFLRLEFRSMNHR